MKISPSRSLLLLFALALLPASVGAECCVCSVNGTNCSACCYPDQRASCVVYNATPSLFYCGCTCEPLLGEGGGGGGGVGCSAVLNSRTSVMGVDRADREAKLAPHQLGFGLSNSEKRRDGVYTFEEWAVVSSEGVVLRASDVKFAARVQEEGERFKPRRKGAGSAALVIEDADHPENSRAIPLPKVETIDIDAELTASLSGQEIWFRAEVGKDEAVDQVLLLNVPDDLVAGKFASDLSALNKQLRSSLRLRYADQGRHRVVVFGQLRATLQGHLVMASSRVLLPKCCCNGRRCV